MSLTGCQNCIRCSVLIVCAKSMISGQLKHALKSLGFAQLSAAPSHVAAIQRIKNRPFTHVIFDAKGTDMPSLDFVKQALELEEKAVLIAISEHPRIDDVFSLLRAGARHFIVPPFAVDTIENIFSRASDKPALSEAVLNAPDRNGAFTAVILNNLYRLSVSMRQSREFTSAARDVMSYKTQLHESVELAYLFCEGDQEMLREKVIEGCINRAKEAATRLGRLRKKLRHKRSGDSNVVIEDEEDEEDENAVA